MSIKMEKYPSWIYLNCSITFVKDPIKINLVIFYTKIYANFPVKSDNINK